MSTAPWPKDVFKRPLQIGDYIAAGMSYGQSSVLRVGFVTKISETKDRYSADPTGRFSIRVRWRNNGDQTVRTYSWDVKDSNIKYEEGYSYAKFMILDKSQVELYPADIAEFSTNL